MFKRKSTNSEPPPTKQQKTYLNLGHSISNKDQHCGTLGAFVERDGKKFLISCRHVLNKPAGVLEEQYSKHIYHPGGVDNSQNDQNYHIGNLVGLEELSVSAPNICDFAYAEIIENINIAGNFVPKKYSSRFGGQRIRIASEDFLSQLNNFKFVHKIGFASGYTCGVVDAKVPILKVCDQYDNIYEFNNVFRVKGIDGKNFCTPGDSGALVFTDYRDKLYAIGMLFASHPTPKKGVIESYFFSLPAILKKNGLTFMR